MKTNLKRLTDVANQKKSIDDILNSALEQKCSLYLNIKDNVTLSFNAIHYVPNSNGDYNKITSARNVSTLLLTQGQKFMLSEKAIQAFTLHDIVEGEKLSVVFSQQEGLEINNTHLLSSYSHRDVFIEDSESESRAPYIKLIESAIESLKKTSKSKPNAKAIHEWITSKLAENNSQYSEYLEGITVFDENKKSGDLDYDHELEPYSSTLDSNIILKYDGKPVTRKNFKNQVAKLNSK